MRGELETGTDCYILTQSSSDHSSTSSSFWLGGSTVGHWGPQALSQKADSHAGILSTNWLQLQLGLELTQAVCGTWLYNCLTSTCFLWAYAPAPNSTTCTGQGRPDAPVSLSSAYLPRVHLLIVGSVEGQYVTQEAASYTTKVVQPLISRLENHLFVAASHQTRLDTRSKARRPIKVGIKGEGKVGNEPRLEPCLSVLLIGSLSAMWAWWGKQFHEPKCGSGHVCQLTA